MGQYHKLVNLDKQEVVDPHGLGLGAKQHEHTGAFDGSLSDAIYLLVMSSPNRGGGDWSSTGGISGRWCGDRVVVVGDYTEEGDIGEYENANKLWSESIEWFDITDLVRDAFTKVFPISYEEKFYSFDPSHAYWQRNAVE
jgi:hypothetical protein